MFMENVLQTTIIVGALLFSFSSIKRSLISDLDTIPYPAYELFELDVYFRYSSMPSSVNTLNK